MQWLVWSEVQPTVLVAPFPDSVHLGPVQVSLVKTCECVHLLTHWVIEVGEHGTVWIDTDLAAMRNYVQKNGFARI